MRRSIGVAVRPKALATVAVSASIDCQSSVACWAPAELGTKMAQAARPARRACRRTTRRTGRSRSEEHTSELQSLMRISYAVFCLKKKTQNKKQLIQTLTQ